MTKPLSEQLADLSVRAKHAEDAFAAAQKEAHDKIEARKQKARADATMAIEKVNQKIKSANSDAERDWNVRLAGAPSGKSWAIRSTTTWMSASPMA
jgi:hypothetical protein